MEKYLRSDLPMAVRRNILAKEKELSRKCRSIWKFENKFGVYLLGRYCNGNGMKDTTIVTLASWSKNINNWYPVY